MSSSEVLYHTLLEGRGPEGEVLSKEMELAHIFSLPSNYFDIRIVVLNVFSVVSVAFDQVHIESVKAHLYEG